jgi:Holliday junction resolvase
MVLTLRGKRGYSFERFIVQYFNSVDADGWQAKRLGGSGTDFPDTVIVNNIENIILAVEAKSSSTHDYCYVPVEQLIRCNNLLWFFNRYEHKHIVLAFKFSAKTLTRKRTKQAERKPLKYYFWVLPRILGDISKLSCLRCSYDGILTAINKDDNDRGGKPCLKCYDFLDYHSFRCNSLMELREDILPLKRGLEI